MMATKSTSTLREKVDEECAATRKVGESLATLDEKLLLLEHHVADGSTGPKGMMDMKAPMDNIASMMLHGHDCHGHKGPHDAPFKYTVPLLTPDEMKAVTVSLDAHPQLLRATLHEYGFAVVPDVLTGEECEQFEEKLKEDLLELVDQEAVNQAPEVVKEAYARFETEKGVSAFPAATAARVTKSCGFALNGCLPHGRFAWAARQHPNMQKAFSAAYGGEEALVKSLDVPFFTPGGQGASSTSFFSAHVDQNAHDVRPGLADCEVFQGVLYVWPTHSRSSTTVVLPKSHTQAFPIMMQDPTFLDSGRKGIHYSEVSEMRNEEASEAIAAAWAFHARRVPVPAGGLLLWNSRTVHAGWKSGQRLAQAVCMEPRSRRPPQERMAKMRLAALGLPSTHWASAGMQHDMTLRYRGYFSVEGEPASAPMDAEHSLDDVVLPLKPAIVPLGLARGADLNALADLAIVSYKLTGMWSPPETVEHLLEASVTEEVKKHL